MEFIMSKKLWVGVAVVMSCASVMAVSIIDDFDGNQNAGGWQFGDNLGGDSTVSAGAFGRTGNGVQFADPGVGAGAVGYMQSLSTLGTIAAAAGAGSLMTPSVGTSLYIDFDFKLDQLQAPSRVEFYLTDNSAFWYTTVVLTEDIAWHSYRVWLNPALDAWYQKPAASDFAEADLANYYVGLNISYSDGISGFYNADNIIMDRFTNPIAQVPEPGTISMLGFALASMGLTFRRRLRTMFKR